MPEVSAVESVVDLDEALELADHPRLLTLPPEELPPEVAAVTRSAVSDGLAVLAARAPHALESAEAASVVRKLRAAGLEDEGGARFWVTGQTAHDLDVRAFLLERTSKAEAPGSLT